MTATTTNMIDIVLTKLITENWEHDNSTKKKSDGVRSDDQTGFRQTPGLAKCIYSLSVTYKYPSQFGIVLRNRHNLQGDKWDSQASTTASQLT